jgi:hypothetical protein
MSNWVGKTVGEVLKICGTNFDDVRLLDDPPGKLKAVEFDCNEGGKTRHVVLQLQPNAELFSAQRDWPQTVVERQRVARVVDSSDQLF